MPATKYNIFHCVQPHSHTHLLIPIEATCMLMHVRLWVTWYVYECVCVCVFAHIFAVFYLISVLGSSVQLCPTFCILVGSNKIYNNERTNERTSEQTNVRTACHAMHRHKTHTHTHRHAHTANRHCNSKQQQPQSPQTIADWLAINTIAHTHTHACMHSRFSSTKNISSQFFRRNLSNNNNSNSSKKHNNIMHIQLQWSSSALVHQCSNSCSPAISCNRRRIPYHSPYSETSELWMLSSVYRLSTAANLMAWSFSKEFPPKVGKCSSLKKSVRYTLGKIEGG